MDLSPWLTTAEAADYLKTTVDALHKHIERGALKPDSRAQRGRFRGHRFTTATLDRFVRGETP